MKQDGKQQGSDCVVVLDNIRSAHNVGSIFRTSDAAGVSRIVLCGTTPCPRDRFDRPRPDIAKVALGAEQTIPWEYVETTKVALKALKKAGYHIVALEQSPNSVSYTSVTSTMLGDKWALLLGTEVTGLSPDLLKLADTVIEIPVRGKKESLNVSVAFGIAIFRLLGR